MCGRGEGCTSSSASICCCSSEGRRKSVNGVGSSYQFISRSRFVVSFVVFRLVADEDVEEGFRVYRHGGKKQRAPTSNFPELKRSSLMGKLFLAGCPASESHLISTSADGSIRQWASATGQPYPPNAPPPKPHTLGLTSLSVSRDGRKALYNSIEGTTRLWDVGNSGEVEGTFESFAKSDDAQSGPCKSDSALTT